MDSFAEIFHITFIAVLHFRWTHGGKLEISGGFTSRSFNSNFLDQNLPGLLEVDQCRILKSCISEVDLTCRFCGSPKTIKKSCIITRLLKCRVFSCRKKNTGQCAQTTSTVEITTISEDGFFDSHFALERSHPLALTTEALIASAQETGLGLKHDIQVDSHESCGRFLLDLL